MRVKTESSGSELVSKTTNRGRSAFKLAVPWWPSVPAKMLPMDKLIPWQTVMRDFWNKIIGPLRGGGIRRRLLIWGLSHFGPAVLVVGFAGYSYMARQIRQDAAALQSELASVTAEQIRNFVRRKIERFSDNAHALSLYELASKQQQLLL